MLRNSTGVEAEMTAVQIAGLKRAGTSKTLYLMDERGTGPAKEGELAWRHWQAAMDVVQWTELGKECSEEEGKV
jgi:hypothetical protein